MHRLLATATAVEPFTPNPHDETGETVRIELGRSTEAVGLSRLGRDYMPGFRQLWIEDGEGSVVEILKDNMRSVI